MRRLPTSVTRWSTPKLLFLLVAALAVLAGDSAPSHAWTAPVVLNTNAATDLGNDWNPQVTTDGAGNWVAVWSSDEDLNGAGTDRDILLARSTDNGATWAAPTALNTNAASDWGSDFEPQVTTDGGGNWVAVWFSWDDLEGTIGSEFDILVARSTDNGATWTAPAALNTNAATDSRNDYCPHVATDGGGNWVAVWYSEEDLGGTIGTDDDILVARSTDDGASWTDPAALNSNAASDSGGDEYPQVTTDSAGHWVTVWYSNENLGDAIGTDYDILLARSTDNGATWTDPAALNSNAATDSGHDEIAQVTIDGGGNWVAVWHSTEDLGGTIGTDYDVLLARSTDNGASWTTPAALNTNAASDSGDDGGAEVTTDGVGNWAAVWVSDEDLGGTIGTDYDILVAHSTDAGATWTTPTPLNTNASTDSGEDWLPQVTTDGGGNWVAVWHSDEDLGGTIGTDDDILYTTCSPLDADCDETPDATDNCPDVYNPGQTNSDADSHGDACDNCPTTDNEDQADTDLPATVDLDSTPASLTVYGEDAEDRSGKSVAAGDINADGIDDLIIAAYEADPLGRTKAGETYVVFGTPSLPLTIDLANPGTPADLIVYGADAEDRSGYTVAAGDINGDTIDDVIVGALDADGSGSGTACGVG